MKTTSNLNIAVLLITASKTDSPVEIQRIQDALWVYFEHSKISNARELANTIVAYSADNPDPALVEWDISEKSRKSSFNPENKDIFELIETSLKIHEVMKQFAKDVIYSGGNENTAWRESETKFKLIALGPIVLPLIGTEFRMNQLDLGNGSSSPKLCILSAWLFNSIIEVWKLPKLSYADTFPCAEYDHDVLIQYCNENNTSSLMGKLE